MRVDLSPAGRGEKIAKMRRNVLLSPRLCRGKPYRAQETGALMTGPIEEGLPYPLGAHWSGQGTNFALFSANATKVEVCLFDGGRETRIELPEYTDQVFHGYIPGVSPGTFYGYRVHGPYDPAGGHRFNPNKLLLDPYACAHAGSLT